VAEPRRALATIVGVVVLAFGLVLWRYTPPAALGAAAPQEVFSATRAIEQLTIVLGEGAPHPVGTAANARVRERIVARLVELSYSPRIQRQTMCTWRGLCVEVQNIIATIGNGSDVLLLAAHYDSVAASPGAADDGSGVATILEVARILKQRAPPKNTIALLVDDGEEAGLLGAKAFMQRDPLAKRVSVAINIEARGSSGLSLMFETAGATRAIASLLGELDRPATSSLFSAVYERLPNDTDFSVFKKHGVAGFNFAFIDNVAHYHTSLDDIAHLDPASIQHHGDNVLALTTALSDADLSALHRGGDAVWFDVLGLFVVSWPERWTLPLALLALLLTVASVVVDRERRPLATAAFFGLALLAPVLAVTFGWGLFELMATAGSAMPRYANLTIPTLALAAVAAAIVGWLGCALPDAPARVRYAGLWMFWAVLGVVLALLLPAVAYLFVAPALVAGVLSLVLSRLEDETRWPVLFAAFVAALIWLNVAVGLVQGVGMMGHPVITAVFALAFSTAMPALGGLSKQRTRIAANALGFAAACTASTWLLPIYDAQQPQRMSISHHQHEGDAEARWWIDTSWGALPPALAAFVPTQIDPPLPWVGVRRAAEGPAPATAAKAPAFERVSSNDDGSVRYRIESQRGASVVGLLFAPGSRFGMVNVHGTVASPRMLEGGPWQNHFVVAFVSEHAIEIDVSHGDAKPKAVVFDVVLGLPDSAAELLSARGLSGVPSQDGDLSFVSRAVVLR
jgi:hypothetical protein